MWSQTKLAVLCLLLACCTLAGCGYRFAGEGPTLLGDGNSTLRISSVENPTMLPWLPQELRSRMRDEVNKRNLARWVDNGKTDYLMRIRIISFSLRSSVKDDDENTLLYSGQMTLEATITDGSTNAPVWTSNQVSVQRNFDEDTEDAAGRRTAEFAVRRLLDQLYQVY